jgi:hypothetical protein
MSLPGRQRPWGIDQTKSDAGAYIGKEPINGKEEKGREEVDQEVSEEARGCKEEHRQEVDKEADLEGSCGEEVAEEARRQEERDQAPGDSGPPRRDADAAGILVEKSAAVPMRLLKQR